MKRILLFLCCMAVFQFASAQTLTVSGQVTSSDDNYPLPGVSVVIKGTTSGTFTDVDGYYEIDVDGGQTLVFSSIGFVEHSEIVIRGGQLDIALSPDSQMLDEVVAIGYGVMKKSDLTGSVASVKGDQLKKTPASGLDQALQGLAAGVTVTSNSGQPGAAAQVRIRGIGTVNDSSPIYVVDGVIVSDISYVSPNDIVSTEILKDASATAIYGSRGANGVILVTTKKGGENDKVNVSFDAYAGIQSRWNKLDLMGSHEFASTLADMYGDQYYIDLLNNSGVGAWVRQFKTGNSRFFPSNMDYGHFDTDWQDEVFRNAVIQNYHLSFDGGNQKSTWAVSASYFNQEGTVIGSDYNRITLRANSAHKITKWLKIGENLTFMNSWGRNAMNNNSSPAASILSAAIAMAPWDPVRYPEGAKNWLGEDIGGNLSAASNFKNCTHPYSMVEYSHPSDKTERWVGDIFAEITPLKGLVFRSDLSLDLSNVRHSLFKEKYQHSNYDKSTKNFVEKSMSRYSTLMWENTLTYSRDIGKHSFSAMAGQTTEEYNYYSIGGSGASILNPAEKNWYLSQTTEERSYGSDSAARSRRLSFLGRLHYGYDSRYLVTLNFRADGSSKFIENVWGYFPSTALAWRLSNESWMKNIHWLDELKLRVGWGRIGNDKIGDNAFMLTMANNGPYFLDYVLGTAQDLANGATILTYVNQGGKWETTEQWNVGVDFGFFDNRLTGTVDVFRRDTKEMLLGVKAPAHVGNRWDPTANVGTVRNDGIEISLNHRNRAGQVDYYVGGNLSFIKNELTAMNGGSRVYGDRTICDEGYALYTFWGYDYLGIYESDAEIAEHLFATDLTSSPCNVGDAKYADYSGPDGRPDGVIDDYDKVDLGNPFPWLTYAVNMGLEWKGIDLQLFFQGVFGNEIYNAVRLRTEGTGNEATFSTTMRNVWTVNNPDGVIPNPYGSPKNKLDSSRLIEDGSYLRLKNLQLGYTLPSRWTEKVRMSRCRIYFSANNLLTLTKYTGYDPEVGGGVDYGNYPQARTYMFGVNINF